MKSKIISFKPAYSETSIAIEAAICAGKEIIKIYDSDFSVEDKGGEPLTEADLKSQKIIFEKLAKYPVLSEEFPDDKQRLRSKRVWIVDPLDGTQDFVNKTGEFSIMIALVEENKPILGVIYQPTKDLLFIAQKDNGAYKRKNSELEKLNVNDVNDLPACRAIVSRHHLANNEREFLHKLNISNFRQYGSCGLKVSEISQGNAELYFTFTNKIKQWDTCAAYCLITEAGGRITDMMGNDILYNTKKLNHENGILVTNGKLHQKIVEHYRKLD